MVHKLGPGRLRIDTPIPAKPNAPAAKPGSGPVAAKPAEKTEKPLSRLEQLRRERQQATAGSGSGSGNVSGSGNEK
jgi:hypothetical protein